MCTSERLGFEKLLELKLEFKEFLQKFWFYVAKNKEYGKLNAGI